MKKTLVDRNKYLGFNDTWVMLICIPVIGILMPFLFFSGLDHGWKYLRFKWFESMLHIPIYWLLLTSLMVYLRKKYSNFEYTAKRMMIQGAVFVILGLVIGNILHFSYANTIPPFFGVSDYCDYNRGYPMLATYFVGFFVMTIYEAKYFYDQLRYSIEEREAAKQAQIRSELEGLRNQVNPHFLFNSMNTLMNLVMEDQQIAVSFLKKLSKVYRYVLESRDEPLIPLSRELDFIHSYVFLQQERFRGNLQVDITISDEFLEHKIIPLSLQILFENAIKHNIISKKSPLHIQVFLEKDRLVVQNNLQRKEQVMDSTKVGLENIRTRYQYFTEQELEVIEEDGFFIVKIPIISSVSGAKKQARGSRF